MYSSLTHGIRPSVSSVCSRKTKGRRGLATNIPVKWNRLRLNVRSQQTIQASAANLRLTFSDFDRTLNNDSLTYTGYSGNTLAFSLSRSQFESQSKL